MHICTRESFMAGAIEMRGYCPVCCKKNQPLKIGWVECLCNSCGNYFSSETPNRIVKERRKLLGLSREEISTKLGLTKQTIAKYENDWPSKKYWKETERLIKEL